MPDFSSVANHCKNHPVPADSRHAYFLLLPPNLSHNPSDESLRAGIDVIRRHEQVSGEDELGPLYCKTWILKSTVLQQALEKIHLHVKPLSRDSCKLVLALLAHAHPSRKTLDWGGVEISIKAIINWAGANSCIKVVLFLGCGTALPTKEVPFYSDKAFLAVTRSVSYDHLWLFYQMFLNNFRQYCRENSSWNIKQISLNAMHASCNSEVTKNKICQYP